MGDLADLTTRLKAITPVRRCGEVSGVDQSTLRIAGLARRARVGDRIAVVRPGAPPLGGELVAISTEGAVAMTYEPVEGVAIGDVVRVDAERGLRPCAAWAGRIVDAFGEPLDGRPLPQGERALPLRRPAPPAAGRRLLGTRLGTGLAAFDTMLPLVRGQRMGVFAGSGVGKSMLLGDLARGLDADIAVIALIGERGRELREFVAHVLGPEGLARSVVVVATSDQSPLVKRRAAWAATSVAESFRDEGRHVLLLVDSLTRFAEAHREIALTAGETPSLRAYPPSTANLIAALAERAGPGLEAEGQGDVTAVFTVLVAGSDMEEPVADITRGVLDGHAVLDRAIAERGRFPALDIRRSVSRSLPAAASPAENALIARARALVSAHEDAAPMIQTGLYSPGSDPAVDEAIRLWPALDAFFAEKSASPDAAFARLAAILGEENGERAQTPAEHAP